MENKDKPAFPTNARIHSDMVGLTKREYFAIQALKGILSNHNHNADFLFGVNGSGPSECGFIDSKKASKEAIGYADELLKQLEN